MALSEEEIKNKIGSITGWNLKGDHIEKTYTTKDFSESIAMTNRIAELANKEGHHPELEVSYGHLKVKLTTHDEGGITLKDITMAYKVESTLKG